MRILLLLLFPVLAFSQGVAPVWHVPLTTPATTYYTVYDTIDNTNRDADSRGNNEELIDGANGIWLGYEYGSQPDDAGFIFTLDVPKNATIDSVWLYYTIGGGNTMTTSDSIDVACYNVDNVELFDSTHTHRLISHAATTSFLRKVAPTGTGAEVSYVNLASIVQTVVNRTYWVSGNRIGFVLKYYQSTSDEKYHNIIDRGLGTSDLARLKVKYH